MLLKNGEYHTGGAWFTSGKKKRFCWSKHRQSDGRFYVWTEYVGGKRHGNRIRIVACAKKKTTEARARARAHADAHTVHIDLRHEPKDPVKRLEKFKQYATWCRERSRNAEAANFEIKAAALEQSLKKNPPVAPVAPSEEQREIERLERNLKRWKTRAKRAATAIKKITRKLKRLGVACG